MFVDLVGSSAVAERLDAEDLLEVLRAYREVCGHAIQRYGGHMARFLGDGILAYFCYPIANENDPERSLRAALEIVRSIETTATPAGEPLRVRVGIATGQVVISDLFAGGETDRQSVVGSTPNLAARLQGYAPPGGIVIADETHSRIASLFRCIDLDVQNVRGFAVGHRAWQVISEPPGQVRYRFAELAAHLTPFVGRDADFDLAAHWRSACEGRGSTLLVAGEAGSESRGWSNGLLPASGQWCARDPPGRFCADRDSPLYPIKVCASHQPPK